MRTDAQRANNRERSHLARVAGKKEWLDQQGGECVLCGETNYELLEADHIIASTKAFPVGRYWSYGLSCRILEKRTRKVPSVVP